METVNIGIIGGCMTCQTDIKLSQLFYRALSANFLEKDDIRCLVSLRYYNEYFRIPEKAEHLVKYVKPERIILQIRPAPFIMRSEFLIQDYRGGFLINPLVCSKNLEKTETILGTKDPVILQEDKLKGFYNNLIILPLLKHNIRIGNLFSLKKNALKSLSDYIISLDQLCKENHISLYLIGTINSYTEKHNDLLSWMNEEIKKLAEVKEIPYLDIFTLMNDNKDQYFGPDRFHLNAEGHALVARMLYSCMHSQLVMAE